MADFISTTGGKIINVEEIAFLTTRTSGDGGEEATQLIVGFSAATTTSTGSMMPLSLVLQGEEALDFMSQLGARGVVVDNLAAKLAD